MPFRGEFYKLLTTSQAADLSLKATQSSTAVKRLSMSEKLCGDRDGDRLHVAVTTAAPSCELERNFLFTSMKFIGDDREEEEELMT